MKLTDHKLTDLNLSYPYVWYNANIVHITSRRSTAIEWLILEAVSQLEQNNSAFQTLSVEEFFFRLFVISDSNKIIKPLLLELRELGALVLDDIYDDTDLKETPMSCIHLTTDGKSLQKVGKLPGNASEAKFSFYYDIAGQKIVQKSSAANIADEPKGVRVTKTVSADEIAFPMPLVRQEIMNLGSQKKLKWFDEGTEIVQIFPISSELKWKTVRRKLCINDDLTVYVEGVSDPGISEEVLTVYSQNSSQQKLPKAPFTSLDGLSKIGEQSSAEAWVHDEIEKTKFYVADASCCSSKVRPYICGKGEYIAAIMCGCDALDVSIGEKSFVAKIPEQILPAGNKFLSEECQISIGAFSLRAGDSTQNVNLSYSVNEPQEHFAELIVSIIEKYFSEKLDFIFLYHALGQISEFQQHIRNYINGCGRDTDIRLTAINSLNDAALLLYGKKCVSDEEVKKLLIDRDLIAAEVHDPRSAVTVLRRYIGSDKVKKRETLVEEIIHTVLDCVEQPSSLKELHQLWAEIKSIDRKYINLVTRNNWHKPLYTEEILTELAESFGEDDVYSAIEEYTSYERNLHDIQSAADRCRDILPEISFTAAPDEELIRELIISNPDQVKDLYRLVDEWKDAAEKIHGFLSLSNKLHNASEAFLKIELALSLYYNDEDGFKKICILDTSTLMNDPEILSLFQDGNTMVIIPQIALSELDGLKDSEDEATSFKARNAVRMINEVVGNIKENSEKNWLNMQAESAPELLSKDLDPNKPDNKIISVALKFITKLPLIISDDNNMRNLAVSQRIESISSESFRLKLLHEHEEQPKKGKKNKKQKK